MVVVVGDRSIVDSRDHGFWYLALCDLGCRGGCSNWGEAMKDFATESKPIRASSLYKILECPGRVVLETSNEVGSAAETGSLVHLGVVTYHKTKSLSEALKAMRANQSLYPKSIYEEAEKHLTPYTKDPRNQEAEVIEQEKEVKFSIDNDIDDPYGPIYIIGHFDQIRRDNGRLYLWDIKTGKKYSGWEMLHVATVQLAAYCIGASQRLSTPVYPGGIICTYGYRRRNADAPETCPGGVFFNASWELRDCGTLLRPVVRRVMEIRGGEIDLIPGDHCSRCMGLDECLPKMNARYALR